MRFQDKVVIITGAAGGIGLAAVRRFASEGAHILAVDLEGSDLDAAIAEADPFGVKVFSQPADCSQASDVSAYVERCLDEFGRLDVLFNNAGIEGRIIGLMDYPEDDFDQVINVNLRGVWLGMKYSGPAMIANGGGSIVNTASTAGLLGARGLSAYVASKHGVVGLTKSAALELVPQGVRVNAVCPSPIETRMMRSLEQGFGGDQAEMIRKDLASRNPMGRYGEPDEVAALVAFLASDDASYINGGIYTVDGGSVNGR
ncbi:MAG: SDR family NAD(P)-dependent oxidoreductase [Acidimicrobiales bacterium]|jgi:NAD(P)-dependent dehydrogenase (short-subunit alcohol dehydrogenase family)|nr:SDR family NAD(P)-dependent oxidoreductase [Acidimicrobiales bacterium]